MKKVGFYLLATILGGLISIGGYKLLEPKNKNVAGVPSNNVPAQFANYMTSAQGSLPDFTAAAELSVHAVVHIQTEYEQKNAYYDDFFGLGELFGISPYQKRGPLQGAGSGVIIQSDGYIVTNNHVVQDATKIDVTLNDKRSYRATVVGTDPSSDLAVIKIDEKDLPFLVYGNSDDLKIGEWVLAVGNPFNLTSTVTAGIVSAKARNINILGSQDGTALESFIQTDAAVNRGNSGGAMVNTKGELVGINAAIASGNGYYTGYSFAIPVNIVRKVVSDLINYKEVQRAFIGVQIQEIDSKFAEQNNIKELRGVYVAAVTDGGSAEQVGIKAGDIIIAINNTPINSSAELLGQIGRYRPGDKVKVDINRKGKEQSFNVELKNKDNTVGIVKHEESDILPTLGATLKKPSADLLKKVNVSYGMQVVKIEQNGVLNNAGVREGFIITEIDRKPIKSMEDINKVLKGKKGGILVEGVYPNGIRAYYGFGL